MGTTREEKQYRIFRDEVLKYEQISIDELWILMARFTQGNMGRRFFNQTLKSRYYKFWIRRLQHSGIIEETKYVGIWKVYKNQQ